MPPQQPFPSLNADLFGLSAHCETIVARDPYPAELDRFRLYGHKRLQVDLGLNIPTEPSDANFKAIPTFATFACLGCRPLV